MAGRDRKVEPVTVDGTTADAPLLTARDLLVGYGLPVCPPLDVAVRPGEAVLVVGANGTGKSTLLRTLLGHLDPLGGSIGLLGGPADPRRRDIREAVAQDLGDDAFFPALTVREHLTLVCRGHAVPEPDDVVDELLEEFGLTARADAMPSALSSGQRRRLLLAAAFARPRSLLVLDEPEQRLDTRMRRALTARLAEERAQGGAVLAASHDPDVVAGAATAVLLLGEDEAAWMTPEDGARAVAEL